MSKDEILNFFSDINYAYNDSTRLVTLNRMLDELIEDTAQRWHRVEEPKEEGRYLVWDVDGFAYVDIWKEGNWQIASSVPETNISHWMPIEPPKEDA